MQLAYTKKYSILLSAYSLMDITSVYETEDMSSISFLHFVINQYSIVG